MNVERGLTLELSRGAQWPSGGVALAYTASAATKQRRLERIVRPQDCRLAEFASLTQALS